MVVIRRMQKDDTMIHHFVQGIEHSHLRGNGLGRARDEENGESIEGVKANVCAGEEAVVGLDGAAENVNEEFEDFHFWFDEGAFPDAIDEALTQAEYVGRYVVAMALRMNPHSCNDAINWLIDWFDTW